MHTILLVDDQVIETRTIRKIIENKKLPLLVSIANNGQEALELVQSASFDILFTDIKMPRMDGLTLARHTKKLNPFVQLIIYSAFGEFEFAKEAIDLGAIHYLLKPLDIDEFLNVMEKTIELCEQGSRVREALRIIDENDASSLQLDSSPDNRNAGSDENMRKVVRDIQRLVASEYGNPDLDIEYLASQVFLSTSYLGHLFKTHTGQNLGKYIIRVRMEQAKLMLTSTHVKVSEIGLRVGYANPSYFSQLFKNHYGCTPVHYREKGMML